ncbi:MAG: hypothetical protein ABI746_04000 [Dermatophilaceae bacterium]
MFIDPEPVVVPETAADELVVIEGELEDDEDDEESLPQADRLRGRAIARAMKPARAVDFFMRGAPCW